jgi:hypothetical protein
MKNYILVLGICFITFNIATIPACSRESPEASQPPENKQNQTKMLSDAELMERYHRIITELNLTTKITDYERSHVRIIPPERKYDSTRDTTIYEIWNPINITFDIHTGEVYFIYNTVVRGKILESKFDPANKMHVKTEIEIKAIAEDILKKLPRQYTSGLQLESIKFVSNEKDGHWIINWERSQNGYTYQEDGITIYYHEKYGLESYANWCTSEPCPTEVKITKEEAGEKARDIATKAICSSLMIPSMDMPYNKWFKDFEVGEICKSELVIINPNYLFTKKSSTDITKRSRNARLSWVISIKTHYTGKPGPKGEVISGTVISIWIDAATGEMLGGMFTM